MSVKEYLIIMRTMPVKHRSIIREHKMYKVYLPSDSNDIWEELHRRGTRFDVIVLIPEIKDESKPELLKLINKIVMRKRTTTKEHKRFKIYLPSAYSSIWEYLSKNKIKVDLVLVLR